MNLFRIIPISLYIFLSLVTQPALSMIPNGMSEAELMAQINAEIEREVAKMSPQDQQKFYAVMENIEQMAENDPESWERFTSGQMSKEEEEAFVNAMVPEEMAQPAGAAPKTEVPKPEKKTEEAKPKVVATKKDEAAIDVIDNILKLTSTFLAAMQSVPEVGLKVDSWAKKKKIDSWKAGSTWKSLADDINLFVQKLYQIKQGPKTENKYAYIKEITQNESLLNNLKKVLSSLEKHVAAIKVSPFGIDVLDKKSRKAAQMILGTYSELLYTLLIPKELDDILAKYEPELKKQKEKEEKIKQEAEQEAKRPRGRESLRTAGREEDFSSYGRGGYDSSSPRYYDGGSSYGGGYTPSYSPSYGSRPSSRSRDWGDSSPSSRAARDTDAGQKERGAPKSFVQKEVASGKPTTKETAEKAGKTTPEPKKFDDVIQTYINNVSIHLQEIIDLIKDSKILPELSKHLDNKSAVDRHFVNVTMPEIVNNFDLAMQALDRFATKIKKADDAKKKEYQQALDSLYTTKYAQSFDAIKQDWQGITTNWQSKYQRLATAEKRYAYLGESLPQEQLSAQQEQWQHDMPKPGSIQKIVTAIDAFEESLQNFGKEKPEPITQTTKTTKQPAQKTTPAQPTQPAMRLPKPVTPQVPQPKPAVVESAQAIESAAPQELQFEPEIPGAQEISEQREEDILNINSPFE